MIASGLVREPERIRLPDLYEVIDGKIRELLPMSLLAIKVGARLYKFIDDYAEQHDLGRTFIEAMFRLENLDRSRRPDVMFFSFQRWPKDSPEEYVIDTAAVVPDLAIEVVSPSDVADELFEKLREYFECGVRVVWVVYPRWGVVHIYESLSQVRGVNRDQELDGGEVLPGFRLRLSDFLPEPQPRTLADSDIGPTG